MNKNKLWTILFGLVLLLQAVAEGLSLAIILRLNMLPSKYVIVLVLGLLLLLGLTALLLLLPWKRALSTVRRVLGCLLALGIVVGCGVLTNVVGSVQQTVEGISSPAKAEVTRGIYVRIDDPAKTLADAAEYTFARVTNYDVKNTDLAIEGLEREFGKTLTVRSYDTVLAMVDGLYTKEVDAIILNSSYILILEETEGYEDFLTKARLLYEAPIILPETEPTTQPTTEPTEAPTEPATVVNTPFAVYIGGSDTRYSWLATSRNDVNILAVVNPETKQILLINTPRDYYVPNPAGDGALDKLTHCGIYGVSCSAQAVGNLYGITVDYYAQINFAGFKTLVDAVGGVTVYSDVAYKAQKTWIEKGENYLNGEQALDFARERYRLSGGDRARGNNQMKIVKAIIQKMTSGTTIISNYSGILGSLSGMFKTDMSMDDISLLVKMQLSDMAQWNIVSYAVSGSGGSNVTYSAPGQYLYVMYQDEDMVNRAKTLIDRVIAGEILTDADVA